MKTFCYVSKRVVRASCKEVIIRPNKVCLTLVSRKCEMHVIFEVKDYTTSVVCKSKFSKSSNVNNSPL